MVGSAVATMVWSSAPRNIASMMPKTMRRISACESGLCPAHWLWAEAGGFLVFFGLEDLAAVIGALHRAARARIQGSLRQGCHSVAGPPLLQRKLRRHAAFTGFCLAKAATVGTIPPAP